MLEAISATRPWTFLMSASFRLPYRSKAAPSLKNCLRRPLRELTVSLQGLRRQVTAEGVHRARIAVRRVQALLWVFRAALSASRTRGYRRTLKRVMRALGRCRDADVLWRGLVDLKREKGSCCRDALDSAAARVAKHRLSLNLQLQAAMGARPWSQLLTPCASDWILRDRAAGLIASSALEHLRRRLGERMRKTKRTSTSLHRLRRKVKTLRYALQGLEPRASTPTEEVEALKAVQECIGKLHDLQQLRHALRRQHRQRRRLRKVISTLNRRRKRLLHDYEKRRAILAKCWCDAR
jgi:triphosphatase